MNGERTENTSKTAARARGTRLPLCVAESCRKAMERNDGKTAVELGRDLNDLALTEDLKEWLKERGVPVWVLPAAGGTFAVKLGRTMSIMERGFSSVVYTLIGMGMLLQLLDERRADMERKAEATRKLEEQKEAKRKAAEEARIAEEKAAKKKASGKNPVRKKTTKPKKKKEDKK